MKKKEFEYCDYLFHANQESKTAGKKRKRPSTGMFQKEIYFYWNNI